MDDPILKWKQGKSDKEAIKSRLVKITEFNSPDIDQIAQTVTAEAYNKIDCLSCGNCCRTTVTTFTLRDISRISKHLGISKKAFKRKYVFEDIDGRFTSMGVPCPFLLSDNKCQIYEVAPEACSSYPHTQRKLFNSRRKGHLANAQICPITFTVLADIESKLFQQ